MYHECVHSLDQTVLEYMRRHGLLKAGDRVGAAVSGGADSVALLRLLMELRDETGTVLTVVHFNHKLRGAESDEDERFVAELAAKHRLEFYHESGEVKAYAAAKRVSPEAAARVLRYAYFRRLLKESIVDCVATAHTLDDQAETVLLKVVRGSGSRGLAGIYPRLQMSGSGLQESSTQHSAVSTQPGGGAHVPSIVRPLLATRRQDLTAYLKDLGQSWREDPSNRDLRHARNRVRHGILPRLERNLNPAVREALAETAEIARAEEAFWKQEISRLLPQFWRTRPAGIRRGAAGELTCHLPKHLALQRRIVLAAAELLGLSLEFKHVEKLLGLAASNGRVNRVVALPQGWTVRREKDRLRFMPPSARAGPISYEYALPVPGSADVPEIGSRFEAVIVSPKRALHEPPEYWLNPEVAADALLVRNWRAGDRFWPAHTKAPKKVKELLAEKHLSGLERQSWPVVVSGRHVVWVRGFRTPRSLRPPDGAKQILVIRQRQLQRVPQGS
jgi:tRNA(Ile)-lysidine synthase